ncbi:MAG: nucleotidyltransferase domain-containing protein, partial [Asgard group archaeon]|nr:nucleotidyltransferase domain-containing protein [Asgard group archaeon]
ELKEVFIDKIQKNCTISYIKSIVLGGSLAKEDARNSSDIDILVICQDGCGEKTSKEISELFKLDTIPEKLDIKIIEKQHIKHINNSVYAPFFHHFVTESKIVLGENLSNEFKLNDMWCYQAIQKSLDRLDQVIRIQRNYYDTEKAEILLFEIVRGLLVIKEFFVQYSKKNHIDDDMLKIFGDRFHKIKKKIRIKKNWISVFRLDLSKNEMGFDVLSIKKNKRSKPPTSENVQALDMLVEQTRNLAFNILKIINY